MIFFITLIIGIGLLLYILKRLKNRPQRVFFILIIIVLYLVATGKAHWISALVIGLIPIVKKLFFILRYLPIIQKFRSKYKSDSSAKNNNSMSKKEAAFFMSFFSLSAAPALLAN